MRAWESSGEPGIVQESQENLKAVVYAPANAPVRVPVKAPMKFQLELLWNLQQHACVKVNAQ